MQEIALSLLKYKYLGLLPLAMAEGPLIALIAGFLVSTHIFSFWFAYATLLVADLIPDTFFYCLGYYGARTRLAGRLLNRSKLFTDHFDVVMRLWERHPFKTMFLGKLAYGLGMPFLTSSGVVQMPFGRFVSCTVPITLLQYGVIMGIGYWLGSSYGLAKNYILSASVLVALAVVLAIGYFGFAKYIRKRFLSMGRQEGGPRGRDEA